MTSIRMRHHADAGHELAATDVTQTTLLACGVVSSFLYAAIDLFAGLSYDGYSFYSQTISELGATGAPKPSWLAPLFLMYCALMVTFAIGVLLEGIRNDSRLKIVGALLLAYMLVGSGTSFFPMHVRGTATLADDLPHIMAGLAATTVALVTIGVGSTALGRSFRKFSWLMFAGILIFGALTAPSAAKLAAGEPTPGMGLLERLAYYSMLIWFAGLSLSLLRRNRSRHARNLP
jgi:hypothetical membrane protein